VHRHRLRRAAEARARPLEVDELLGERREFRLARLAGAARGGERRPDEGPTPHGRLDVASRGERVVGERHGVAVDLQPAREVADGRKPRTAAELASLDLAQDLLGDLPVDGPAVPGRIALEHDVHGPSL
jgi:hypothetical protein